MNATPSHHAAPATEDTFPNTTVPASRLRRRLRVPLVVFGLMILAAAGTVAALPAVKGEGTMLGASGAVPGGVARINGVIPLELDGWVPQEPAIALTDPAREGTHQVRIILELTALDPGGIEYSADDFTIDGWGSSGSRLLWADPVSAIIAQGEVVTATQVFEIPNKSIELTLRADEYGFSLGTEHHTR